MYYWNNVVEFKSLEGKIFTDIKVQEGDYDKEDEIVFVCDNGENFSMQHQQDCCESVRIEEIIGSLDNLLNSEILLAEEVTNNENQLDEWDESFTWTFYKLSTIKGDVTIRWYGTSNGYYSEDVDLIWL